MNNNFDKYLNCDQLFKNSIDKYIEVFVSYYGEEQRSFIETKFKNAQLVGYLTSEKLKIILGKLEEEKENLLIEELLNSTKLPLTKEDLFINMGLKSNYSPIKSYREFYSQYLLGPDGIKEKYYKDRYQKLKEVTDKISFSEYMEMVKTKTVPKAFENCDIKTKQYLLRFTNEGLLNMTYRGNKNSAVNLLNKIDPEVTFDNIEEKKALLHEMSLLLDKYDEIMHKFNLHKEEYKEFYEIKENDDRLRAELDNKYRLLYLNECKGILPENKNNELIDFLNSGKDELDLPYDIKKIMGSSIGVFSLFESFNSLSNEKLIDNDVTNWEKDMIKENRIQYFKLVGIDRGDNYESYLNVETPDTKKIDELMSKIQKLKKDYEVEFYENRIPQIKIKNEREKMGFINSSELNSSYVIGMPCVITDLINKNGNYDISGSVMINFDLCNEESFDHIIVHELNHLYELSLINKTEKSYKLRSGWDVIETNLITSSDEDVFTRDNRKYELFNEIINEKIAQEISELMVEYNVEIFGKATKQSYTHVTQYENTNYLVKDFFKNYKQEILASRINNNVQIIFDAVGEDNFNELNNLFWLHNKHFGGYSFYKLAADLTENRDTNETKIYHEIIEKRDNILNKMRDFYENSYKKGQTL